MTIGLYFHFANLLYAVANASQQGYEDNIKPICLFKNRHSATCKNYVHQNSFVPLSLQNNLLFLCARQMKSIDTVLVSDTLKFS